MAQATTTNPVSPLVVAAFLASRTKYADLHRHWIDLSIKLGGLLPQSTLMMSNQREGEMDLLLRCMENETAVRIRMPTSQAINLSGHYQLSLSESWVGGCYEILRVLRQRETERKKQAPDYSGLSASAEFRSLIKDFELLRISIEKHEIPKNDKLKAPLKMVRLPLNGNDSDSYFYDRDDPSRAHNNADWSF